MSKQVLLRVSDEKQKYINKIAADKGMSVNAYINMLISDNQGTIKEEKIGTNKRVRFVLSEEDKQLLAEKSEALGLTPSEFICECIRRKSFVNLSIEVKDVRDLMINVDGLVRQINGIATALYRSEAIYQADVRKIIEIMSEINNCSNEIRLEIMDQRRVLYEEAKKEVFETIEQNRVVRRRRKRK